jgi:hypothetical protein
MAKSILILYLLLLSVALPVFAFVERLSPYGGTISCHQVGAYMIELAAGKFADDALGNKIKGLYNLTWTAKDALDNTAVAAYIQAGGSPVEKLIRALRVEGLCGLAEEGEATLTTPNAFRQALGIATQ